MQMDTDLRSTLRSLSIEGSEAIAPLFVDHEVISQVFVVAYFAWAERVHTALADHGIASDWFAPAVTNDDPAWKVRESWAAKIRAIDAAVDSDQTPDYWVPADTSV